MRIQRIRDHGAVRTTVQSRVLFRWQGCGYPVSRIVVGKHQIVGSDTSERPGGVSDKPRTLRSANRRSNINRPYIPARKSPYPQASFFHGCSHHATPATSVTKHLHILSSKGGTFRIQHHRAFCCSLRAYKSCSKPLYNLSAKSAAWKGRNTQIFLLSESLWLCSAWSPAPFYTVRSATSFGGMAVRTYRSHNRDDIVCSAGFTLQWASGTGTADA